MVPLSVIPEYKPGPEGEKHDAFTRPNFIVRPAGPRQLKIDNTDSPRGITAPGAGVNIVMSPAPTPMPCS